MSLIKSIRNKMHGVAKDAPLDYSQITDQLYIGAWPTKYNRDEILNLDVSLIISTILEGADKELGEQPLTCVKVRMSDAFNEPLYTTGQLDKGVEAAMQAINQDQKVMVYCKAGKHRSATMTACILIAQGHSSEESMDIVRKARPQADYQPQIADRIRQFEKHWHESH